jgi:hypothetical protein
VATDCPFADLRRLADALSGLETRALRSAATRSIDQLVGKLGVTCVPFLARTMRSGTPVAREAARAALAQLAAERTVRTRVLDALRTMTTDASDEVKVSALGLLAELGEPSAARFADPAAIQRRSALALAAQLDTPSEIANAADMMVKRLDDRDVVQMIEVLLEVAPAAAHRLAGELALRLDVDPDQRARIAAVVADAPAVETAAMRSERPTHVAVLVDATARPSSARDSLARIVVVATRKCGGERRWRRWAVLIGEAGVIDDCLHEETLVDPRGLDPTATLISNLCADGYRVTSSELDHACTLVSAAARRTLRQDLVLTSGYYLGRDLLDLRDAHVIAAVAESPTLARAVDLLAGGDAAGARALFERCPQDITATADWNGAYGACLLALGDRAAAVAPLERAIVAEPAWPLHHWNLAAALHPLGDARGCQAALRRFVSTSAARDKLVDDPAQPGRIAHAKLVIAEIERIARLDRKRFAADRKRAAPARPRATARRRKKPAR